MLICLCLSRRIKEDESERTFELNNDVAVAHALEAAPVDDSIVYTMTTILHESINEKNEKNHELVTSRNTTQPIQCSPFYLYPNAL
jgi:hypothetical protein